MMLEPETCDDFIDDRVLWSAGLRSQIADKQALRHIVLGFRSGRMVTNKTRKVLRKTKQKRAAKMQLLISNPPGVHKKKIEPWPITTAVHEAGHAVIACVLGGLCAYATCLPQRRNGGFCTAHYNGKRGDRKRGNRTWSLMFLLAGGAAERVLLLKRDTSTSEWSDMTDLFQSGFTTKEYDRGRRHAERLVRRHLPAIKRVAAELMKYGALNVDEIDKAIAGDWEVDLGPILPAVPAGL